MNSNYNPMNAQQIEERLVQLIEPYLSHIGDPVMDREGRRSAGLRMHYRFVGVGQYVVHGDCSGFREKMKKSASLVRSLFRRADGGENIAGSYLSLPT